MMSTSGSCVVPMRGSLSRAVVTKRSSLPQDRASARKSSMDGQYENAASSVGPLPNRGSDATCAVGMC